MVKQIKIFIASPGGLEDERNIARTIAEEVNASHSEHWRCQIKLVGWEFTLPGYNRAQALINKDLDTCTYFLGLLWDKWGSKPNDGDKRYTSGFEEEYERAKLHCEHGIVNDIYLLFKNVPPARTADAGPSLAKVLEFKKKCIDERKPLFDSFDDTEQFKSKVRRIIEAIGWREADQLKSEETKKSTELQTQEFDTPLPATETSGQLFDYQTASFLQALCNKDAKWPSITATEVARLRLVGISLYRPGNDETHVGPHDANLIYRERHSLQLSELEISALVEAGLAALEHQNIPLWHWLSCATNDKHDHGQLYLESIIGSSTKRAGALRILQRMGSDSLNLEQSKLPMIEVFRVWFCESDAQIFSAAATLVKSNFGFDAISSLEELAKDVKSDNRNEFLGMLISVAAKVDIEKAIDLLVNYDPAQVSEATVGSVFDTPERISTEQLVRCMELKSETVRTTVVKILFSRGEIETKKARELISSSDFDVRLLAVKFLEERGEIFTPDQIKSLLTKRSDAFFSYLRFGASQSDSALYQDYLRSNLAKLTFHELREKFDQCYSYGELEFEVLCDNYPGKIVPHVIDHINDGFHDYFSGKIAELKLKFPNLLISNPDSDLISFLRDKYVTWALDAMVKGDDGASIHMVRTIVDRYDVLFSENVLKFLAKFGDWSDVPRVLAYAGRRRRSFQRLSPFARFDFDQAIPVAKALYAIGKSRLPDLLTMNIDSLVMRELLSNLRASDAKVLDDSMVVKLFDSSSEIVRKAAALFCCRHMGSSRVRRLLQSYSNRSSNHFYNVIHWLDLGASMPRDVVRKVVLSEIRNN